MSLRLVAKFAAVSWQSLPSESLRRFGVPTGGALDRESLMLANASLGKDLDAPVYEVIGGMTEWVAEDDGSVAVVGSINLTATLSAGETLKIELGKTGFTYYVAWSPGYGEPKRLDFARSTPQVLRVVKGPQAHLFDLRWMDTSFEVSNQLSRAGFRLTGSFDDHHIELPSEPACTGAIQVTPDGTAIILGPDGPTIGGYPKVAIVCSADLDQLAHLRPGSSIRFEEISVDEARALKRAQKADISQRLAILKLA